MQTAFSGTTRHASNASILLLIQSTDPHPGNLGVEILDPDATAPSDRVRLVFYDFGQAATLTQRQADGILTIIDAIVDMDVDRSIEAFEQMGVLKEDADLVKVRAKVAENYKVCRTCRIAQHG